tara:strand:- start:799 stop:3453 length:2655 start_codon:yes stop_codon:yes gene_type:complete
VKKILKINLFIKLIFFILFFFYSVLFIVNYVNQIKYEIFISKTKNFFEVVKKSALSTHAAFEITNQSILVLSDIFLKKNFICCEKEITEKIQTINIRTKNNTFKNLSKNLPESKNLYQKAYLLYPSKKWKKIKLRYRGAGIHHHNQNFPSLRLNLQNDKSINLMSHINLTKPEDSYQISNYYNDLLSDKINIINQKTKIVNLVVNNKSYGIYHMHHRKDENLLRANNRLPGPLFILNTSNNQKWSVNSFDIKGELKIFNNKSLLSKLIRQMNINDKNKIKEIWEIAHKDKFAKFFAFMNLIGGIHTDGSHNLILYFDPSTGKFEPVIDDPLGQGVLTMPRTKDRIFNKNEPPDYKIPLYERAQPLYNYMLQDSDFINLKNKYLFQFLNSFGSTQNQHDILDKIYNNYENLILNDFKKRSVFEMATGFKSIPLSNTQFINYKKKLYDWVENRNQYLEKKIETSKIEIEIDFNENLSVVKIIHKSNSNIFFNIKELNKNLKINKKNLHLVKLDRKDNLTFYPILFKNKKFKYKWAQENNKRYFLDLSKTEIVFQISNIDLFSLKKYLEKNFINSITKKVIKININEKQLDSKFHNLQFVELKNVKDNNQEEIILKDKILLKENLIIKKNQKLIIHAGTEILIDKNVSIFSFGKIIMKGQKSKPIIIKSIDQKKPWGSIALIDPGANGSHFEYVEISGGSIGNYKNINFKGMLSVHWVDDITINNSRFYNNFIGDDVINFVHSKIKFENNNIFDCNLDCIDFDYSSGLVTSSKLLGASNDLLDFMGSKVSLENLILRDAKDKAISAGERSIISIKNSEISDSIVGVASKDGSKVLILNSQIINNNLGLDVYRKNLRYSNSGFIEVHNSILNNDKNIRSTRSSGVLIN